MVWQDFGTGYIPQNERWRTGRNLRKEARDRRMEQAGRGGTSGSKKGQDGFRHGNISRNWGEGRHADRDRHSAAGRLFNGQSEKKLFTGTGTG